jgi:hypothetical protein
MFTNVARFSRAKAEIDDTTGHLEIPLSGEISVREEGKQKGCVVSAHGSADRQV